MAVNWSVAQLCDYFHELKLDKHVVALEENEIDGETLLGMLDNDAALAELGLGQLAISKLRTKLKKVGSGSTGGGGGSPSGQGAATSGEYEIARLLGKGAFGVTSLAKNQKSGEEVAIKRMGPSSMEQANKGLAEAHAILDLRHPLLVASRGPPFLTTSVDFPGEYFVSIVLEYCSGGDLAEHLKAHPKLGEVQAMKLLTQLLTGIGFIHDKGMVHRDIKPPNILIHSDGLLRISDLGLARKVDASTKGAAGTMGYMAPEAWNGASTKQVRWTATPLTLPLTWRMAHGAWHMDMAHGA